MHAVQADLLSYTHDGETQAFEDVSFTIPEGSIFAVLGPNGAGKTTLLNLLNGRLRPTGGHLATFGDWRDDGTNTQCTATVPTNISGGSTLTVNEYFMWLQSTRPGFDQTFALELLAPFELDHAAGEKLDSLSDGMRKKTELISAIAHQPRILVLDEPFSGLDPQSQYVLQAALTELSRQKTTVVLSSHQIEVVHYLATHLAILDRGHLCAFGTPEELLEIEGVRSVRELYLSVTGVLEETAVRTEHLRHILGSAPI